MYRTLVCVAVAVSLAFTALAHAALPKFEFQKLTSETGRFTAEMPGQPTPETEDLGDGMKRYGWKYTLSLKTADGYKVYIFNISYVDFEEKHTKGKNPQTLIKLYRSGSRRGQEILDDKEIALGKDKVPGREYTVDAGEGVYVRERLFLDYTRLYIVHAITGNDKEFLTSKDADRFFDLFTITKPPSVSPQYAGGDGELVSLTRVPDTVTEALKRAVPEVQWLLVFRHAEQGKVTWFECNGNDSRWRRVISVVTADGGVLDVRTQIPLGGVPKIVADALRAQAPDFTPKVVQAVGKEARTVIYYRFQGETPAGKIVMLVRSDGTKVVPGN